MNDEELQGWNAAKEALALVRWRIEMGWYYPMGLDYSDAIDWSGHPGESA
jgi:hypothetical protein